MNIFKLVNSALLILNIPISTMLNNRHLQIVAQNIDIRLKKGT